MAKQTGAEHGMSYVAESTYGTTPGPSPAPDMTTLRHTDTNLGLTKGELIQATAREDGQIEESVHGNHRTPGNVDFELFYGSHDDFLAAVLRGSWATNTLKAGTAHSYFSIERRLTSISKYALFTGCVVDSMQIQMNQSADGLFVTGSCGILGRTMTVSGTSLGTPADPSGAADTPFKAFAGSITEGGSAIGILTGITLDIQNGGAMRPVVASHLSDEPSRGRLNITGTITAFFENTTLLEKFINETESALVMNLADAAGNALAINLPRIKYNAGDFPRQGDGDIILNLPFRALRNESDGSPIVITRTAA